MSRRNAVDRPPPDEYTIAGAELNKNCMYTYYAHWGVFN